MARLWSSGFELNSVSANVEWTTLGTTVPTIVTSPVRSGTYAGRISGLVTSAIEAFLYEFSSATGTGPYYIRAYFNFTTFPTGTANNRIMGFRAATNIGAPLCHVRVTSGGNLQLFNGTSQVGSNSAALNTGQWYCIEVKYDATAVAGSQTLEARLDQSVFATASNLTLSDSSVQSILVGGNLGTEANTVGDWAIDDVAINDTTGTSQTSYPGSGKIIHLRPNAAGDNTQLAIGAGGDAVNNYTCVNEVTPDDLTSYVAEQLTASIDDYNIDNTPAGIGSGDTINVVQVGGRFVAAGNLSNSDAIKVRFKKAASGTVSESVNINSVSSTTAFTNKFAAPHNYPLTLYQNPDATTITKATLDTSQIGFDQAASKGSTVLNMSTIWLSVDWTPVAVSTIGTRTKALLGVGL